MDNEVVSNQLTTGTDEAGLDRRSVLRRASMLAGASVLATPTVQSIMAPAFATGTGLCPPGRLVRFKYDVRGLSGSFDSGDGGGIEWCLPDGYADADISVNALGCFVIDGVTKCIQVIVAPDGMSATVVLPPGAKVEDLRAKAGSIKNGECNEGEATSGSTATVTLQEKEISYVAGVICV